MGERASVQTFPRHSLICNSSLADELIREVTINCAERGLLLLRVRDEIRMTIAAYQTLYESSVAFGMRKALQAEQGKSDMERRVSVEANNSHRCTILVGERKAQLLWASKLLSNHEVYHLLKVVQCILLRLCEGESSAPKLSCLG